MKKENLSLFLGLILVLGVLAFSPSLAQAAGTLSFTVAPLTNNVDNLVNQASTTWRFTVNNITTPLATSTDAVEITFPAMQGPNWSMVSLTASSSNLTGTASTSGSYLTGSPAPVGFYDSGNYKVVIMATSTMTAAIGTGYVIDVAGIDNPAMGVSSFGAFNWGLRTCTLTAIGDPSQHCAGEIDATSTPARATLTRRGNLIGDWSFYATSSPVSATTSYMVTFTASTTAGSALVAGERIWVNFPAGFNVNTATTTAGSIASTGNATILANGISATTTNGLNAAVVTINSGTVNAGDTVLFTINDVVNPAKGFYDGFKVFTTTAKGGLIDGTIMGYENTFGYKPPPVTSIQIGGTNTIHGQVKVQTATTTRNVTAEEAAQIQVMMGCPDKNFSPVTGRLDSQGRFSFNNLLSATYMIGVMPFNTNDPTFFINYLQPSQLMVSLTENETATVTPTFIVPDGLLRGSITGGVPNYTAQMVAARAYTGSSQSFSPLFTNNTYVTQGLDINGTGYFQLPIKSGQTWNFAMEFGGGQYYLTSGQTQYWAPSVTPVYIATSTTRTTNLTPWSFVVANKTINVTLQDQNGNAITEGGGGPHPCLSIKRSGSDMMGPGGQGTCAVTGGVYALKVPAGSFSITVMMPGMGMNEYPITVLSTDNIVPKTIVVSRATTYITGTVTGPAPDLFPIQGVNVMAQGSNGGFSQALTNSSGVYIMYVSPGLYQLNAFAPGYGQLAVQNVTVLASPGYATQNYTIVSDSFKTISGRVFTDVTGNGYTSDDTAYEGVYLNAYGNGGGNQAMSRSDGTYTLRVPAAAGYTVEAWSKTMGFIGAITSVNATGNVTGKNFTVAAQGTLQITVANANLYGITQMFASAYSTSTGKGGGSDSWTASTTATDLAASFSVPAGYYKLDVNTPGFGNLTSRAANAAASSTAVTAGQTKSFTISLPDLVTVSGTVTANATVWASRTDGPGKYNTASTSDGAYSLKLPSGMNYMVGASLPGYVNTPVTLSSLSVDTTQNLTLTASAYTISGAVTSSGAAVSEGFAWATKANNSGWIGSEIDASGAYSLGVDAGTWTVYASGPCLQASSGVTQTGSGTVNFALTSISGCSFAPPQMSSIVPSNGGTVATSGISVNIPANALGSGTSNVSFSVSKPNTVPPATLNATPIGNAAKSISASDSNGTSISTLSNSVEIAITYSDSDIVGVTESNLQLAYWNTTTGTWDPIAATLDTVNNTLTGRVDHFTDIAPISPTSEGAPATPANLAATKSGDSGMSLTWDSVSAATSYLLYRDTSASGSFPYLTTKTSISHSDTGLSGGTTYYYKVTASNASGESAASTPAVYATTCSSVANGTVSGASCTLSCSAGYVASGSSSCVLIGGGGPSGGGSGSAPSVPAQIITPTPIPTQPTQIAQTPTVPTISVVGVSAAFAKVLKAGSIGSDVKRLQQLLNSDPDTAIAKSGVGSPGKETTTFGSLTKEAVKKFQCKYGVVCSGDEKTTGYGLLGPKTRAKLAEIYGKKLEVKEKVLEQVQEQTSAQAQAIEQIQAQIQILLQKVQELQAQLNAM